MITDNRAKVLKTTMLSHSHITQHQNIINFGSQTPKNSSRVFTHPLQVLYSASLPHFANKLQQTELNSVRQTVEDRSR